MLDCSKTHMCGFEDVQFLVCWSCERLKTCLGGWNILQPCDPKMNKQLTKRTHTCIVNSLVDNGTITSSDCVVIVSYQSVALTN